MKHFSPVCTLPAESPAFVGAPNVRSTLDIVWTCISVLILSSWSILHLNVPEQFEPQTKWQAWRLDAARLGKKIQWVLIILVVPEMIVAHAIMALRSAYLNTAWLRRYAEQDGVPWSRVHTFFADMGGFVIQFSADEPAYTGVEEQEGDHDAAEVALRDIDTPAAEMDRLDAVRAPFIADMAARSRRYGPTPWRPLKLHQKRITKVLLSSTYAHHIITRLEGDYWVLTAMQLYEARRHSIITTLPDISEAALLDKSKGSVLVKLLALFQVCWMAIQIITRAALDRPSSPLEIMTLSFAVCAFAVYVLSLGRPQDVTTPFKIKADRAASGRGMLAVSEANPFHFLGWSFWGFPDFSNRILNNTVHANIQGEETDTVAWYISSGILSAFVFGGLHLIAWNSPFPTEVEKWLWRASALITMLAPLVAAVFYVLLDLIFGPLRRKRKGIFIGNKLMLGTCFLILALARAFILVEAFRSTYYLPPDAYVNTWAANIPHFG